MALKKLRQVEEDMNNTSNNIYEKVPPIQGFGPRENGMI